MLTGGAMTNCVMALKTVPCGLLRTASTIAEAARANLDSLRDELLSLIEPIAQLTEG